MYPDVETYQELIHTCNAIPFFMEMEGDQETPITLYRKFCGEETSFLLESVEGGNKWGRYSYIGRGVYGELIGEEGWTTLRMGSKTTVQEKGSLQIMKEFFRDIRFPKIRDADLPHFLGGAVGYVGYDVVREVERFPQLNPDELGTPDAHLVMMEEMAVYDHLKQKITLIYIQFDPDEGHEEGCRRLKIMKKRLREPLREADPPIPQKPAKPDAATLTVDSNETLESFRRKVEKAKEYIRKGDIFQVVLSQRLKVQTSVSPFEAYRRLRKVNPSPYLYFMRFPEGTVVGSSPELLVKVQNGVVETCPIAGTRKRGGNEEEDRILAEELLQDEKERSEHLMLVDLGRNDIGKIAEFGSVEVPLFMEVQKFSHVMHLVSLVRGTLQKNLDPMDALRACLPAGTLSGAPKVRAMEIIEELEGVKRGIYGGAVGVFGFNGSLDACITIRTILFKDGMAYIQAGAGIVADSHPETEYEECLNKARALTETLQSVGRDEI